MPEEQKTITDMNNLIWFGNNLRVGDNLSLSKACKGSKVIALFFLDPRWREKGDFGFQKMGGHRARFLLETLSDLKDSLQALNISLLVYPSRPEEVIPRVIAKYGIGQIFLQKEWTRDETRVFKAVKARIPKEIHWESDYDQFLYHPDDLPYEDFSGIPDIFTPFRKKCEKEVRVRPCLESPEALPVDNLLPENTTIPTLEELGYPSFETDPRTAFPFKGGEKAALSRIRQYFWETRKLASYKKTRNGMVGADYSSKLSAWMANGSISARTIYREVKKFEKEVLKNQDTYWLIFELVWRDFFKYASLKYGPAIFGIGGIKNKQASWGLDGQVLQEWMSGSTPQPFINAHMKELALTGWMSNRGRQNVASYWARELGQDWRIGAAYFENQLLDYDVHSNWGNWMYNSGVGNDPRDRKFNSKSQAERYDPHGKFQQLWLQPSFFDSPPPLPDYSLPL